MQEHNLWRDISKLVFRLISIVCIKLVYSSNMTAALLPAANKIKLVSVPGNKTASYNNGDKQDKQQNRADDFVFSGFCSHLYNPPLELNK